MPDENNPQEWPDDLLPRKTKDEGTFMPAGGTNQPADVRQTETFKPNLKPKKSHKGSIILLIVLFILIALGLVGFFAYQKYSSRLSFLWSEQPVDENNQIVQDMKKKAEIAQQEVRKKCPDASLAMEYTIINSEGINTNYFPVEKFQSKYGINVENSYEFAFNSSDCNKGFSVFIKFNEDKVTKVLTLSSHQDEKDLSLDKVKIDYKTVMDTFDKNGGQDYKNQHTDVVQIGPGLFNAPIYGPCWILAYQTNQNDRFGLVMNAETGKIIYKGSGNNSLLNKLLE